MATTRRGPRPRLIDEVLSEAHRFDFFQAVRILERQGARDAAGRYAGGAPVGEDAEPRHEAVRFKAAPDVAFPSAAIERMREPAGTAADDGIGGAVVDTIEEQPAAGPPAMVVNFLGLTGPTGVLPQFFTETLIRASREKRIALQAFLDLFHHRTVSLFMRAWEKHRITSGYERARGGEDAVTAALYALLGFGTGHLRGRLSVNDEALTHYSGLMANTPRSASALENLLSDYFERPVTVRQFQGRWIKLAEDEHSALPTPENPEGSYCQLGVNAVVGDRIWDVQSSFRILIGPLTYTQFVGFMPQGEDMRKLAQLTRLFVGPGLGFDVQLTLKKDEVPGCALSDDPATGPRLGQNCWLSSLPFLHDVDDAVYVLDNLSSTTGNG